MVQDVTCLDTLAPSDQGMVTSSTGAVAAAAERKQGGGGYSFTPIAMETLGDIGPKSLALIDLDHSIRGSPRLPNTCSSIGPWLYSEENRQLSWVFWCYVFVPCL